MRARQTSRSVLTIPVVRAKNPPNWPNLAKNTGAEDSHVQQQPIEEICWQPHHRQIQ